MAAILAVAASDNWNQNASWVGGVQPTAADDVTIVAGANVTIPSSVTALARSVTIAATGTVTFAATTSLLNIGDATAGASNVAFSNSGTITLTANGVINFISTSTTQQTITTGSSTMPNLTFNGAGGSWLQADAITSTGTITLTAGTWATGNFNVTCAFMSSVGSGVRVVTPGSSAITITGSTGWSSSGSNLSFTSNTAMLVFSNTSGPGFNTNGVNINFNGLSVVASANNPPTGNNGFSVNFTGGGTIANLAVATTIKTANMLITGPVTVTGTIAFQGNSATNRLLVQSNALGTARTITVNGSTTAAVTLAGTTYQTQNVDLMDITAAGTASWDLSAIPGLSGDAQGNSGITFTPATTAFAKMTGASNWSGSIWATSSGGTAGGQRVPLPQDAVNVDANSGAFTVTADMPRLGKDINFTGFTGTFGNSSVQTWVFGSVTSGSGMSKSGSQVLFLYGRSTHTFSTAGVGWPFTTSYQGPGGTYTYQDAYLVSGAPNLGVGSTASLNSNGFNVTAFQFLHSGNSTVTMAGSVWTATLNSASTFWGAPHTLNTPGTIILSNACTGTRTFAGGGLTYGTLQYTVANSPGTLSITGANTFNVLQVQANTNDPKQLTLPNGTTTTITGGLTLNGVTNSGFVYLPGPVSTPVGYISTPDSVALRITGDIDIRWQGTVDNLSGVQSLIGKRNATTNQVGYHLSLSAAFPVLQLSANGSTLVNATSSAALADGSLRWVRATWQQSTGTVQFFTSPDGTTWTQLGTNQTIAIASIFASTSDVEIGATSAGTANGFAGKIFKAQILNGIGGTVVAAPDFTTAVSTSDRSFTDAQTNVWTVNGAANSEVLLNSSSGGSQATLNVLAPNAGLIKQIQLPFTGAVSFVGTMGGRAIAHVLAAAASFSGAVTKATTHKLPAALSFTGSLAKRTSQTFLAGLVFVGSLASRIINTITLTASLGFSGTVSRKVFALLSGNLSFVGQTFKSTTKTAFTGSLSFVGNIFKKTVNVLAASLSFVGAFLAGTPIGVLLTASLRFSGSATKKTSRSLTGSLSFVGVLKHMFHVLLTAALAFSGSVSRFTKLSLTSNLSFLGFFRGVLPSIFKPISLILNSFSPTETLESQTNNAALSSETNTAGVESQTNIAVLSSGANTDIVNSDTNQVILKNNTLG